MENQLIYSVSATERLNSDNGRFNVYYNIYLTPVRDDDTISDREYGNLQDVAREILTNFTSRSNGSIDELIISGSEETDARIHIEAKGGVFVDHLLDRPLSTEELRALYRAIYKIR